MRMTTIRTFFIKSLHDIQTTLLNSKCENYLYQSLVGRSTVYRLCIFDALHCCFTS